MMLVKFQYTLLYMQCAYNSGVILACIIGALGKTKVLGPMHYMLPIYSNMSMYIYMLCCAKSYMTL